MHINRHALRAFRECRGLTLTELAERASTSQPHLSNIEAGRRVPSGEMIDRLAKALGVDVLALVHIPTETAVAA